MVALVMMGAMEAAATVMVRVAVSVPELLVALIVTTEMPTFEGVPVMAPGEELSTRPAGRLVAAKLVGEPDAVIL